MIEQKIRSDSETLNEMLCCISKMPTRLADLQLDFGMVFQADVKKYLDRLRKKYGTGIVMGNYNNERCVWATNNEWPHIRKDCQTWWKRMHQD